MDTAQPTLITYQRSTGFAAGMQPMQLPGSEPRSTGMRSTAWSYVLHFTVDTLAAEYDRTERQFLADPKLQVSVLWGL